MANTKINKIDQSEIIDVLSRYLIVLTLLGMAFMNIFNASVHLTVFILLLIIVVFSSVFILRDIIVTNSILNESNVIANIGNTSMRNTYFFLGAIGIGVVFKIISITLFIVTLNYGRQHFSGDTNNNITLTTDNSVIFNNYVYSFMTSITMICLLVAFVFILYTSYEVRVSIINVTCMIISIFILALSAFEMYCSSKFFDVYLLKGIIYQTTV